MQTLTKLDHCVSCGGLNLELTLDLGNQPLANTYTMEPVPVNLYYPLAVNRCTYCNHLQLTHIVDPSIIYRDYAYVSGTSQTYLDYMNWFAKWSREYSGHWIGSVLDIGCNDGSQLDAYKQHGFLTYGIDPAENLHGTSVAKGHKVVCGFFDQTSINKLDTNKFDILVAQNSFAHNPDPVAYLDLIKPLMNDNSLFFVQTSQADMVRNGEFDTIYHEHVSFYNINSMNELCKRTGMHLVDAIKTPIHGTSYVFVISAARGRPQHIQNLIAMESDLLQVDSYNRWRLRTHKIVSEFASRIIMFREQGYSIVGYGAAAKGNTLLNYADTDLDYIIDDNPIKQGKYSPGRHIPIIGSSQLDDLVSNQKILFVPLAWNFFDEIKKKILSTQGNRTYVFLRYFPEVRVEN